MALARSDEALMVARVTFEPAGRRAHVAHGATVMEAARSVSVGVVSACGGHGTCGRCRVQFVAGRAPAPTPAEHEQLSQSELELGIRLACQARIPGDARIEVPAESLAPAGRLQLGAAERLVTPDPAVVSATITVAPSTPGDLRSDARRVLDQLQDEARGVSLPALRQLPERLRSSRDWSVEAVVHRDLGEVIAVLPAGHPVLGLAVDLGTTKVAAYLVDLVSGRTLACAGIVNPQMPYGEDVRSRISHAQRGAHWRSRLRQEAVGAIDGLVTTLCAEAGAEREAIVDCVVVGNTAMHHLLCGLPVHELGSAQYVPATTDPIDARASDLDLRLSPAATLHLPPSIGGCVGADHVAVLAETDFAAPTGTRLVLDIGTNTEVSLVRDGRVWSCSTASGPAFEGARLSAAMRAAPGAIERAHYANGAFHVQTVGGLPALGMCGSGILDVVAAGLRAGIITHRGGLDRAHPLVRGQNGSTACVLVPARQAGTSEDVVFTAADVREVQLAKAAIRAGTELLLEAAGVGVDELEEVIIAGAFGTYLDARSAIEVGLLPDVPPERVRQIGNAAGAGARRLLLSRPERLAARELAARVQYVELATHPAFADRFAEATRL